MYWSLGEVDEVPPGVVTITSTEPAPAGLVAMISVLDMTVTDVAGVSAKATVAPGTKLAPVIATTLSPTVGPALGATDDTDGVAS